MLLLFCYLFCIIIMSIGKDINVCVLQMFYYRTLFYCLFFIIIIYLSCYQCFIVIKASLLSLTHAKQTNKYVLALFGGCMYIVWALCRLALRSRPPILFKQGCLSLKVEWALAFSPRLMTEAKQCRGNILCISSVLYTLCSVVLENKDV